MSHLGIGIIRKKEEGKDLFLVMREEEEKGWKFFEHRFNAINASFKFSEFVQKLEKTFGLLNTAKECDFEFLDETDWESKEKPGATIYRIDLPKTQVDRIEEQNEKKNFKWINGNELKDIDLKKEHVNFLDLAFYNSSQLLFDRDFLTNVEKLQDALKNNKLVIFVGSGVSMNSGIPSWNGLIDELKSDIEIEGNEEDPLILAQLHFNSRLRKEYHERVQDILKHKKVRPNPLHRIILELNPEHIITTNYDNLFEQEIESLALPYSIVRKDSDLTYTQTSKFLVKMHGDFDERNIVLKEDDYLDYQKNFPLIESFIRGVFSSKIVLFIGFSFTDINLKFIIQRVRNILKEDFQPAYLFSLETLENQRVEYLKNRGVRVLTYDEDIKKYSESKETPKENLVEQLGYGMRAYHFLKFLTYYDRFGERNKMFHIIDKMYQSLKVFEELPFIPTPTLLSLYPFSINNKFPAKYASGFHIKTRNEEILELFKQISVPDGKIQALGDGAVYENFKDKLSSIFTHLNSSGIFCIQRFSDNNHNRIYLTSKGGECNCKRCLDDRLDYAELLLNINSESPKAIYGDRNTNSLLLDAYGYFKIGNFIESYYLLKELAKESWHKGNFITYFLCKYNSLQLKRLIKYGSNELYIKKEEIKEVVKEIEKINIDEVIQKLPIDYRIKETLRDIRLRTFPHTIERIIEEKVDDIRSEFQFYESPYNSSTGGENYVHTLYENFLRLSYYYSHNLIFENESFLFRQLAEFFWEGLIVSYFTNDRNENKIKEFHISHIQSSIAYLSPSKLLKICQDYHSQDLIIENETQNIFLANALNFFKSNHSELTLFGTSVQKNETYFYQKEKSRFFSRKCHIIFNNLALILAYGNLEGVDGKKLDELIISLLRHLRLDEKLKNDLTYFREFVEKKIALFTDEAISLLIDLTLDDNIWSNRLIETVVEAVESTNYRSGKRDIVERIFRRTSKRRSWSINEQDILPLYQILDEANRVTFRQKVFEQLNNQGIESVHEVAYYTDAIRFEIISVEEEELFQKYCAFVKTQLSSAKNISFSHDGIDISHDYRGWNTVVMFAFIIHRFNVKLSKIGTIRRSEDLPEYLKWILNPVKYNYDHFEANWVLAFSHDPIFIEKYKSIAPLRQKVKESLAKDYNEKLAKLYFEHLVD